MKNKPLLLIAGLALAAAAASAQSINVTTTGVGIGTATPTQKLDVAGNVAASGDVTVGGSLTVSGPLAVTGAISGGSITGLSGLASASIYTSPDLIYANGTVTTVAHGLGKVPKFWTATLRCVSPELNYAVGDVIQVLGDYNQLSAYQSTANATNFYFSVYPAGISMLNKNGGTAVGALTPAKWRLVFTAINL